MNHIACHNLPNYSILLNNIIYFQCRTSFVTCLATTDAIAFILLKNFIAKKWHERRFINFQFKIQEENGDCLIYLLFSSWPQNIFLFYENDIGSVCLFENVIPWKPEWITLVDKWNLCNHHKMKHHNFFPVARSPQKVEDWTLNGLLLFMLPLFSSSVYDRQYQHNIWPIHFLQPNHFQTTYNKVLPGYNIHQIVIWTSLWEGRVK